MAAGFATCWGVYENGQSRGQGGRVFWEDVSDDSDDQEGVLFIDGLLEHMVDSYKSVIC